MPRRLANSHRARWALLTFATYWALTPFVNAVHLAQILTLVLIFVVVGVIMRYSRQVWESAIRDDYGAVSQLAQGIWLAFVGLGIGLTWGIAARLTGADWMLRSPVVGFYLLCYVVAGTLHMTARRDEHGRIKREDIRDVFLAYATGLVLSLILIAFQLGGVLRTT